MQELRDEEPFPEFAADEVPVEKRMLEHKTEREDEFPVKDGMVVAENAGECDHEESCPYGREKPQLEDASEKRSDGCAAPEKGENERRHPEIGDGAEDGVVGLEEPEVPVGGGPEVTRDEILDEK